MITRYHGVNLSSKNPELLVKFYNEILGIPITQIDEGSYDGAELGFNKEAPVITVWDENRWGKASEGPVNFVFHCDDLEKTYLELKHKGVDLYPPAIAEWGGKELPLVDPDGNKILLL